MKHFSSIACCSIVVATIYGSVRSGMFGTVDFQDRSVLKTEKGIFWDVYQFEHGGRKVYFRPKNYNCYVVEYESKNNNNNKLKHKT